MGFKQFSVGPFEYFYRGHICLWNAVQCVRVNNGQRPENIIDREFKNYRENSLESIGLLDSLLVEALKVPY